MLKDQKQKRNATQDIEIARLEEWKISFEKRFDNFIQNDFTCLRREVKDIKNWLFYGFVAFIGLSVLAQTILNFFK